MKLPEHVVSHYNQVVAALPKSTHVPRIEKQERKFRWDNPSGSMAIIATARWDDRCGNGHNSFSITGSVFENERIPGEERIIGKNGRALYCSRGGCVHDEIERRFPELRPLIRWHLFDPCGPMHYLANVIYFAGDRDHWGMRKGEFRQHTSRGKIQADGVEGVPHWELKTVPVREVYAHTKPEPIVMEWVPSGIMGEGKAREFDAARRTAVWPEATDEQLSLEPAELAMLLIDRLPGLVGQFKSDVESIGFVF